MPVLGSLASGTQFLHRLRESEAVTLHLGDERQALADVLRTHRAFESTFVLADHLFGGRLPTLRQVGLEGQFQGLASLWTGIDASRGKDPGFPHEAVGADVALDLGRFRRLANGTQFLRRLRESETETLNHVDERQALVDVLRTHVAFENTFVLAHHLFGGRPALGEVGIDGQTKGFASLWTGIDASRGKVPGFPHEAFGADVALDLGRCPRLRACARIELEGAEHIKALAVGAVRASHVEQVWARSFDRCHAHSETNGTDGTVDDQHAHCCGWGWQQVEVTTN
mmetsp:Transcript_28533/g.81948  ORF Transcript_28533/g.81948 Transcript_28533/m.81948 type:complete len:284 (+) Transcript_28533:243-1094(+)